MVKNRKDGFTLLEMLTVIGILGILMASAFTGIAQAQRQGRVAKAQGEIRQIVNAWFAYEAAHDAWPAELAMDGVPFPAAESHPALKILLGKAENADGELRVYLNMPIRGGFLMDPWGKPYELKTTPPLSVPPISDKFSAAVTFPNRNRPEASY